MAERKREEPPSPRLGLVPAVLGHDRPLRWKVGDRVRSRAYLYRGYDINHPGGLKPRAKLKHRGRITHINGGYITVLVNSGYEIEFYDVELERYR